MPCSSKFEKTIDLACVSEIISDIRNGDVQPLVIVDKLLWVSGCSLAFFKPNDGPVIFKHLSDELLVKELETSLKIAKGQNASASAIDPEIISLLVQLLIRWLSKLSG